MYCSKFYTKGSKLAHHKCLRSIISEHLTGIYFNQKYIIRIGLGYKTIGSNKQGATVDNVYFFSVIRTIYYLRTKYILFRSRITSLPNKGALNNLNLYDF